MPGLHRFCFRPPETLDSSDNSRLALRSLISRLPRLKIDTDNLKKVFLSYLIEFRDRFVRVYRSSGRDDESLLKDELSRLDSFIDRLSSEVVL